MKIEKGIPIPYPAGAGQSGAVPVIKQMIPGDSVFFEVHHDARKFQVVAYNLRDRGVISYRFAKRKVEGGYRVWCVEAVDAAVEAEIPTEPTKEN